MEVTKSSYRAILKEKNYLIFTLANLISRFGDSVDAIAFGFMVYGLTGSASIMALLYGVNCIPNILFQPFSGALVERFNKKKVIICCDLGRGIVVASIAILFMAGLLNVPIIFIASFLNSTFEAFRTPAGGAIIPLILSKENYNYGISLSSTSSRVVELVGLAVAGAIVGILGTTGGILIDAASFILCGLIMCLMQPHGDVTNKVDFNFNVYKDDLKSGFLYLKKSKLLFNLILFTPLVNILFVPINTLGIVYVSKSLKLGPEVYSIIQVSLIVGIALGSFVFPKLNDKIKGIKIFVVCGIIMGLAYMSYCFIPGLIYTEIILALVGVIFGLGAGVIIMQLNVISMQNIEKDYMARVFGIMGALSMSSMPLGSFLLSGICKVLSTTQIFLMVGILTVILFLTQIFNKNLREL